jgi:hypothetical protein
MKSSVLINVLHIMHRHCKNKVLTLQFYANRLVVPHKSPKNWQEHEENLPEVYYEAEIAVNTKIMRVYHRTDVNEEPVLLSEIENVDLEEFIPKNESYTVHRYRETTPFSQKIVPDEDSGSYRLYEEQLKYEGSLFILIFKLIGETVSLTIASRGRSYLGYYISGRVIILDTDGYVPQLIYTNFYEMTKTYPDYEVIDFNPSPYNMNIKSFSKKFQNFTENYQMSS